MSANLFALLKAATGEASMQPRLGKWRQAISKLVASLLSEWLPPATGVTVGAQPLAGYTTGGLVTGAQVYVQNIQAGFTFDAASTATADQISIVQANGPGRFIRNPIPSPEFQTQTSWFIDPVAGFDENTGLTAGAALKTDAERQRRTQGTGIWPINADTTITYLNNVPTTDPVIFTYGQGVNGFVRFKGVATVIYTSPPTGFSAVTNLNRAAQTRSAVTEVGLGAGRVGQRIRTTSGANAGAITTLAKDNGGGAYITSPWGIMNLAATPVPGTPTNVNVSVNDQFVVESLTTIARLEVSCVYSLFGGALTTNGVGMTFENIQSTQSDITFSQLPVGTTTMSPIAFGCRWHSAFNGSFCTSYLDAGPVFIDTTSGSVAMYGCLCTARVSVQNGSVLFLDFDTLFQGATMARVRYSGTIRLGAAAAFDAAAADGVLVEDGTVRTGAFLAGTDLLYGNGNGTFGIEVDSGGKLMYSGAKPIITGGTNDTKVGGAATAYAGIPVVTAANNAMIVVFQ